jgi:hypothetical protein
MIYQQQQQQQVVAVMMVLGSTFLSAALRLQRHRYQSGEETVF